MEQQSSDLVARLNAANDVIKELRKENDKEEEKARARRDKEEQAAADAEEKIGLEDDLMDQNFGKEFSFKLPVGSRTVPEFDYEWSWFQWFLFVCFLAGFLLSFLLILTVMIIDHSGPLNHFLNAFEFRRDCANICVSHAFTLARSQNMPWNEECDYICEYGFSLGDWFDIFMVLNFVVFIACSFSFFWWIFRGKNVFVWEDEITVTYEAIVADRMDHYIVEADDHDLRADAASLSSVKHKDPYICKVIRTESIKGRWMSGDDSEEEDEDDDDDLVIDQVLNESEFYVSLEYVVQMLGARGMDYGRTFEEAKTNFQQISGRIQNVNLDRFRGASLALIPNSVEFATAVFSSHKQERGPAEFPRSHPV
jgi:hypothetical protein